MNKRPVQPIEIPDNISVPESVIKPDPFSEPPPKPDKPTQKTAPKKSKTSSLGVVIFHHTITVFILLLLLGVGVWSYLTFSTSSFFVPGNAAATPPAAQSHIIQAQLQRIATTLETYEVIHERYPARLEELVDSGLLLPSDLYYPLVNKTYHYVRYQQSYDLSVIDKAQSEFEFIAEPADESDPSIKADDHSP